MTSAILAQSPANLAQRGFFDSRPLWTGGASTGKVDPSYVAAASLAASVSPRKSKLPSNAELKRIMSLMKTNRNGANYNGASRNGGSRAKAKSMDAPEASSASTLPIRIGREFLVGLLLLLGGLLDPLHNNL